VAEQHARLRRRVDALADPQAAERQPRMNDDSISSNEWVALPSTSDNMRIHATS